MMKIAMVHAVPIQRLPLAQQERLMYIDMRLRFLGEVRRQDLIHRFGIQTAAATRDLAMYRSEMPGNLIFVSHTKSYIRSELFVPLYDSVTAQDALAWFSPGPRESGLLDPEVRIPVDRPEHPGQPSVEVLEVITIAIKRKLVINAQYMSPHAGPSERVLVPHALADIRGLHLVRAFDRATQDFENVALSSIKEAALRPPSIQESEYPERDSTWAMRLTLQLRPHPNNVEHPQCLQKQDGSPDGVWRVDIRAALVDDWLHRFDIDSTKNHRLRGPQHVWWLQDDPRAVDADRKLTHLQGMC